MKLLLISANRPVLAPTTQCLMVVPDDYDRLQALDAACQRLKIDEAHIDAETPVALMSGGSLATIIGLYHPYVG